MANSNLEKHVKSSFLDNLIPVSEERLSESLNYDKIYEIPVGELIPFRHHTFDVEDGQEMDELVQDIKECGRLIHPIVVRKTDNGRYEIISGHRRKRASELAGLKTVSAIVMELTDEEAVLYMATANFSNRKHLKHSEKAKTYELLYSQYRHQGVKEGEQSLQKVAQIVGDNAKKVQRYLRIANLLPELLKQLDHGYLGFVAAVELAGLTEEQQKWIYNYVLDGVKIGSDEAKRIATVARMGGLTEFSIGEILFQKPKERESHMFTVSEMREFFPEGYGEKEMRETIVRLLREWNGGLA